MVHYTLSANCNIMQMSSNFQFMFSLGKEHYGYEEQLSSPVAILGQDRPNLIFQSAVLRADFVKSCGSFRVY